MENKKRELVGKVVSAANDKTITVLVETYKIKPEVQTIMNMDRIVEYSDKVTKALNTIPVVTLTDNKGRPMEIPPEEAPEDFVTID